ncbi:MAG: YceI family protein [Chloroflexi bacterium]|nr:YceI family protein [Chloroflexota bacterium]
MIKRLLRVKSVMTGMMIAAVVLTACGGAATAPTATSAPAATAEPTIASTVTTEATPEAMATEAATAEAATAAPEETMAATATTESAASTGGAVTYRIVPEESKASYTVDEVLFNQNNKLNTAIGVTNILSGELTIDKQNPANSKVGTITVDISVLTSDSGRRDNAIRDRWLESVKFPIVTFAPTSLEGLPSTYTDGEELAFKITGDMMVRNATKPVTFDVKAKLDGDRLTGTATTTVKMTDFNFDPPDIAGILKANDEAILTLEFVAMPQ